MDQSVLSGDELCKAGAFTVMVDARATEDLFSSKTSQTCAAYLQNDAKTLEKWRLEKQLATFENRLREKNFGRIGLICSFFVSCLLEMPSVKDYHIYNIKKVILNRGHLSEGIAENNQWTLACL